MAFLVYKNEAQREFQLMEQLKREGKKIKKYFISFEIFWCAGLLKLV
jgi:hypothetical protein